MILHALTSISSSEATYPMASSRDICTACSKRVQLWADIFWNVNYKISFRKIYMSFVAPPFEICYELPVEGDGSRKGQFVRYL